MHGPPWAVREGVWVPGGAAEQAEVRKGRGSGCDTAGEKSNSLSDIKGKGGHCRHKELLEQRQDGFSENMSVVWVG